MAMGFVLADIPGRLSWRALRNWCRLAPRDSTVVRVSNPELPFTQAESRIADIADLVNGLVWLTKRAHFKDSSNPPKPLPRPGWEQPPEHRRFGAGSGRSLAEIDAWVAEIDRRDRAGERRLTLVEEVT